MLGHFIKSSIVCMALLPLCLHAQTSTRSDDQTNDDVVRVETNLVTVPVSVKTRAGSYITDLGIKDFHLFENGVEQDISRFDTIDKPFTVFLMLDVSDSTKAELPLIQEAALAFLTELKSEDRVVVIGFDKQVDSVGDPTGDAETLRSAIHAVRTGGGTALYDAIDKVVDKERRTSGRKAIIVMSDGINTSSVRTTSEATLHLAEEQYALIYPIQYNSVKDLRDGQLSDSQFPPVTFTTPKGEPVSKAYERGTHYLESLARTSGGRFYFADNVKNLRHAFDLIAQELRQQYSFGYYPKNPAARNAKRHIKVEVSVKDAVVHARESYSFKPTNPK